MWRFVLRENIRRFETLIQRADSDTERESLRQLLQQTEEELDELEQVSTPALVQRDAALKYLAEHAVDEAVQVHAAQFSSLQIYDRPGERLIIIAQRNFRAPFLHHLSQMRPGDGSACGRCLQTGAPAAIGDVNSDPDFEPHRAAALEAGFQAVAASPVPSRSDALIAVLSIYFSKPRQFRRAELEQMGRYSAKFGAGLEHHLPH